MNFNDWRKHVYWDIRFKASKHAKKLKRKGLTAKNLFRAGTLAALITFASQKELPHLFGNMEAKTEKIEETILPEYPINEGKGMHAGHLEGRVLNTFLHGKAYTGIMGEVPQTASINFEKELKEMWETKIRNAQKAGVKSNLSDVAQEILAEYDMETTPKTTINKYVRTIDEEVNKVKENLDWKTMKETLRLSEKEMEITKDIATHIEGKDMLAYSLTELMEANRDGELNASVYDYILRNAGPKYLESIPALGDNLISKGPYQLTQHAVKDTGKEKKGASMINQFLPEEVKIPGSVRYLRGGDHHRAAFLFAVNNISYLVSKLNDKQLETLGKKWESNWDDIVKFIATSHHNPTQAKYIAKRWLDNDAKYDYTISAHGRFLIYSKKTQAHLDVIYKDKKFKTPLSP